MTAAMASLPGRNRLRRALGGYMFLLPWLIGFVMLTAGPMLASLYLSMSDFQLSGTPNWIGLDNYIAIFTKDPRMISAITVTLAYVLFTVPAKLVFALLLALVLNRGIEAVGLYRAMFYLPSLLGGSVAVAVVWRKIFGGTGPLNEVFAFFGLHTGSWVSNPNTALNTLIILGVWQFGSPMLIFLAGLRQIPKDIYDAASMDGARWGRTFFFVTLPLLTPFIFFNLVIQTIDAFKAFTPAFIISSGTGGPIDSTLFYTLYVYQQGFAYFHMGYASALAWLLLLAIVFFTALAFLSSRFWVYDESR